MEDLYYIANKYYRKVESFKAYNGFRNRYSYISLIGAILFLLFFKFFFEDVTLLNKAVFESFWFWAIVICEIIMLWSAGKFQKVKNRKTIDLVGKEFNCHLKTVDDAKIMLLKSYFSCTQNEFADVSEKITSMLSRATLLSFTNEKTKFEKVTSFIYESDAKARILALFALLCSMITILSIKAGQDINSVITFFETAETSSIIFFYAFVFVVTLVVGYGFSLVHKTLKVVFMFISLELLGKNENSIHTVKHLAKDLNKFHLFSRDENEKLIIIDKPHDKI